ncbi:hypothetical protein V492_00153 [Pseudogymnoascus sp. VKM F-4246]|nr:hypothetical protein V492_00153 [Pseudogymnoascus sp. VKM F-4246]
MSPSTASPLEDLPLVILEHICEYLAQCDCKRRSCLRAFSLTSSRCCSAAAAQRFCQIPFAVQGRNELKDDLKRWSQVLSRGGSFRYVRRLKILGPKTQEAREALLKESPDTIDSEQDEGGAVEMQEDNIRYLFEMQDFCKPSMRPNYLDDDMPLWSDGDHSDAWKPLADFIGQLTGLQDLVWVYASWVPRCVLSVIHSVGCRLHMHDFYLSSLVQNRDKLHDVDPDEFALATSPCLHSIIVPISHWDSDGDLDYNEEAVLRMVAGVAPRLAHVWMRPSHPGNSIALQEAIRLPRPDWPGFFPGAGVADEHVMGSLQSLIISDSGAPHTEISNWSRRTDFSKLCRLSIQWNDYSRGVITSLQKLKEIAQGSGFKCLHTLVLSLPHGNNRPMQDALISLLGHLNSIETLDLNGFIGSGTLESALISHGGNLRRLRVTPYRQNGTRRPMVEFSEAVVQRLVELCANLEQVEFPINRTHSDSRETGIHRALGRLSRLKHVLLKLKFSIGTVKEAEEVLEETPDNEDEEEWCMRITRDDIPVAADIQDGLKNGAIDSSLALSIFNLISSGSNLRYLKLQIEQTEGPRCDQDLNEMLDWIGRNWVCERDDRGEVSVRELGKKKRVDLPEELKYFEEEQKYFKGGVSPYLTAWNNTWPQTSSVWWENWKSVPLSEEADLDCNVGHNTVS